MASTVMNQQRSPVLGQNVETEYVFATLEAVNSAGKKMMTYLGNNYSALSHHHRGYLKVKRKDNEEFEGQWNLTYNTTKNDLVLALGKGSLAYGEKRGVDILLDCPPESANGVAALHALLGINTQSGFLIIEGMDDNHPVQYFLGNKLVSLGGGKHHCLWQNVNRFILGNVEFKLTYAELDQDGLKNLRQVRDRIFKCKGLPAPHEALPVLPPLEHRQHLQDNNLLFGILGAGSYGIVHIAIDIITGDPRAVKSIQIKHLLVRQETLKEAFILLKYPGTAGLLQASHVSCEHGNSFQVGQADYFRPAFSSCQGVDVFHFVMPFATGGDFSKVHLDENNIRDIIKLLRGPMEGLKFLHDEGYIHRDVTCRNMFVMADGCGVLGDYGKIVKEVFTKCNRTGPPHTRAPEVDGTSLYGQAADVWSFAFAIMKILFKDLYSWATFSQNNPQSKAWANEASQKLSLLNQQSSLHAKVAKLVTWMLTYEQYNRPTMEDILTNWPDPESIDSATTENLKDDGRPTKFQKTSGNTKVARQAPVWLGWVPPEGPPLNKISTDKILQQIQKTNYEEVSKGRPGEHSNAMNAPQPKYDNIQGDKK